MVDTRYACHRIGDSCTWTGCPLHTVTPRPVASCYLPAVCLDTYNGPLGCTDPNCPQPGHPVTR